MDFQLRDAVAAYGALVATTVLAWNVGRELRERGRVRLTLYVADIAPLGSNGLPEATMLAGTIVNLGRRPIHITGVAAETRDGRRRMVVAQRSSPNLHYEMPPLPCELSEGQTMTFRQPLELLDADAVGFCATDTTGRTWRLPRKVFRKLHKEVAALLAERVAGKRTG